MSYASMPLFTGDYQRDTPHLSMAEHGAYFKLLMFVWDQRGPAPIDERKLMGICNARSTDEILAMRRVLEEFFILAEDGWYNKRMQREIERFQNISHVRSEAGKLGYQAKAKHLPSKSQASASIPNPNTNINTNPSTIPPLGEKPKARTKPVPSASGLPEWLDAKDWAAYLDHRRGLRKPMTGEAQRRAILELDKLRAAGNPPAAVIEQSLLRGWTGLFPVKEHGHGASRQDLLEARNSRAAQEWLQQGSRTDDGVIDHATERQG